jgi:replicative DNA helicase
MSTSIIEATEDGMTLPFSSDMQDAVIGWMFKDKTFYVKAKSRIEPQWFLSQKNSKLFSVISKFEKQHGRSPSTHELENFREITLEPEDTQRKLMTHLHGCIEKSTSYGLDFIKKELTPWLRAVTFKRGIDQSVNMWNQKDITKSYSHVDQLMRQMRDITFDDALAVCFSDFRSVIEDLQNLYKGAMSTGLTLLDRALVPDHDGGSLLRGDMTVLLAALNLGKTTTEMTIAVHNALLGKKVLFVTHEGNKTQLSGKIIQCALHLTEKDLFKLYETEEGRRVISLTTEILDQNLSYIHYEKPGMCVEDVEPIIYQEQERLMARGSRLDLVFNDYPGLLRSRNLGSSNDERIVQAYVYRYFSQMFTDLDVHGIVAVQSNREGSKVIKAGERCLTTEDVAEAWGIPQIAANMISLNRQIDGMFQDIMTYYVCKTRSNRVGGCVACQADLGRARMHGNDLGAVSYTGNIFIPDRAKKWIQNDSVRNTMLTNDQVEGDSLYDRH